MRSVFIHPVSTNYPCIYSVLLGIRIVLQNEQGWRSGESTRLPLLWHGFNSQSWRHMCVVFVGALHRSRGFSGFPLSLKITL